jgi:hypothetical protein
VVRDPPGDEQRQQERERAEREDSRQRQRREVPACRVAAVQRRGRGGGEQETPRVTPTPQNATGSGMKARRRPTARTGVIRSSLSWMNAQRSWVSPVPPPGTGSHGQCVGRVGVVTPLGQPPADPWRPLPETGSAWRPFLLQAPLGRCAAGGATLLFG